MEKSAAKEVSLIQITLESVYRQQQEKKQRKKIRREGKERIFVVDSFFIVTSASR